MRAATLGATVLLALVQAGTGQTPDGGGPEEPAAIESLTVGDGEAAETAPNPYLGDLFERYRLSGDWLGQRTPLAERGITFDVYATQFYQGIADGGRTTNDWEYGGKLDYLCNLDGGKLGLWQGFFVNMHAETRYGNSVNNIDGLLAPSNIAMQFPASDETITAITGLKLTQALNENLVLFGGKINTLDEYPLRYSPDLGLGRPGIGGFMNTSLVFNPILARTVPYSAAAIGGAVLVQGAPIFSLTVFDPEERATKGLQDLFARGVTLAPDLLLRTRFFGRPGQFNLGGTYSNSQYRSTSPAAYLVVPVGAPLTPLESGSWCLYYNFYQSLWVDPTDEKRTWGLFAQTGLSDGNPNPIRYVLNAGVGGRSMFARRPLDTFGAGFFFLGLSDEFKALTAPFVPQQNEYGVELFYNYAIAPWCRFTTDLQIAEPSTKGLDTVIIPGLRLEVVF